MGEWKEETIGEVTANFDSMRKPVKGSNRSAGIYPYYGASGIVDYVDDYLFDGEYLLIAEDGENLRSRKTPIAFIADGKFWVNNHAHIVRGNDKAITRYLLYVLNNEDISGFITGSTIPKLSQKNLNEIRVLLPNLDIQRKVVDLLCSLDDKIKLNRQMNATLEATARALFKSWFVDFDPVRAKMEGRAPDGLSADIAALFPDTLVDSSLGEIPKGWEEKPMDQMIDLIGGGTPKTSKSEYWDGDIPWFSVADTPSDTDVFVLDTEKHISKLGAENSSTKILSVGTTIVTARGTVGKLALVGAPMAMNQSCYGIQGINGDAYWTYFLCRRAVGDLQQRTHGSVFDTITRSTFSSIQVVSPSAAAIEAFDKTVAPILNKIRANLINNKGLAELRDTLLPKLISGELRVGDAGTLKEAI